MSCVCVHIHHAKRAEIAYASTVSVWGGVEGKVVVRLLLLMVPFLAAVFMYNVDMWNQTFARIIARWRAICQINTIEICSRLAIRVCHARCLGAIALTEASTKR